MDRDALVVPVWSSTTWHRARTSTILDKTDSEKMSYRTLMKSFPNLLQNWHRTVVPPNCQTDERYIARKDCLKSLLLDNPTL